MHWRANETGQFYIKQHPGEAHLTVDDLRDMIGREGEAFSNEVVHYSTSLRGTKQYWFKEKNKLIAMIDTLGMPTILFTHSAAHHQWPQLANLICPEDPDDKQARARAVVNNPAIAHWFFTYRIQKLVEAFYVGILGATDYWMRFEWQHIGSPHVLGLAWLANAPNVENLISSSPDLVESTKEKIIEYADKIMSTINAAVLPDGSNMMLHHLKLIRMFVINHILKSLILKKTSQISLLHAKDILAALKPTVFVDVMASKSVDLDTLKICNQKPSST